MSQQETALQTAQVITLGNSVSTFLETELLASSAQTVRWYRARLRLFVAVLGEDRDLGGVTERDLICWYRDLRSRTEAKPPTLSHETFHGYVRAVRRLFKWLYSRHITVIELWPVLKLPKIPDQTRKGIHDKNVKLLIEAASKSPRDYAILLFLESTGCRRGGVASLQLSDLNIDEPEPVCRRVTVHEKAQTSGTVFMNPKTLDALRAWLSVRQSKTDYVFTDERPGHDEGLQPGAINQMIARYKKKLGLSGSCSPHKWRHRFSRVRLKNKMPLNIVSQLLRHKTVVVTAKYYGNLLPDELQELYDGFTESHPESD